MKKTIKKVVSLVTAITVSMSAILSINAVAKDNVTLPAGVTYEMTNSSYWKDISNNGDKVIMTASQIKKFNDKVTKATEKTKVKDLESFTSASYGAFPTYESDLYINGEKIDQTDGGVNEI